MFKKLRRGLSGERKPDSKPVTYIRHYAREREHAETMHPDAGPKAAQALHEQDDGKFLAYYDALSRQRGERLAADGSLVRLELVDPETGEIASESEMYDDSGPNPPPPPISAA